MGRTPLVATWSLNLPPGRVARDISVQTGPAPVDTNSSALENLDLGKLLFLKKLGLGQTTIN